MGLELTVHDAMCWMACIGMVGTWFSKWTVWRVARDMGTAGILVYLAGMLLAEGVLAVLGAK